MPEATPRPPTVAPSILSADFGCLADAAAAVAPVTDWLHVDVMDGHFVPNLTIGPPVVASLRRHSGAFFDCHLMVADPGAFLGAFCDAGADSVTVHAEVGRTAELLDEMAGLGLGRGLALNPDTPFEAAAPYLGAIDLLLVMTVHPGFGGQSFMDGVVPKIAEARRAIEEAGLAVAVEVDGGVSTATAGRCAAAGAEIFVAGSAVFGESDPALAVEAIRAAALAERRQPGGRTGAA